MDLSGKINELISNIQNLTQTSETQDSGASGKNSSSDEVSSYKETSVFAEVFGEETANTVNNLLTEMEEKFADLLEFFEQNNNEKPIDDKYTQEATPTLLANKSEKLKDVADKKPLNKKEKTTKKNKEADFLEKLSKIDVDIPQKTVVSEELITPENIDEIILLQEKFKETTGKSTLNRDDLVKLNTTSKIFDEESLEKHIQNGNFEDIIKTSEYVSDVMPNFEYSDTTRGKLIKEEIDLLMEASITGQDVGDLSVPTLKSVTDGVETTKIGDVFEVEGEDKIYLKTADDETQQLDISKDAYNKLFPPLERYMSSQGKSGDCYLVSTLNNLMTDPNTRGKLLNCFSEDEKGNITVDLPNGDYTFTLENGKEVTDYEDSRLLSDSSMGMQMLELCYGVYLKNDRIDYQMDRIETFYERMEEDEALYNYSSEEIGTVDNYMDILGEYTSKYGDDKRELGIVDATRILFSQNFTNDLEKIVADFILPGADEDMINEFSSVVRNMYNLEIDDSYILDHVKLDEAKKEVEKLQKDDYGTDLRSSGGKAEKVFEAFGLECDTHWLNREETSISDILYNSTVKIVAGGTYGTSDEDMLNEELNIAACHSYTIYPVLQENGEYLFEVINPWDESQTSILTEAQMNEYFDSIQYVYI